MALNNLVWSPHPILADAGREFISQHPEPAETLEQWLRRSPIDTRQPLQVQLDGRIIPRDDWPRTPLTADNLITVRAMMHGGEGSDPMQSLLTIAVLAATPQIGTGLAGLTGMPVAVANALVTVGGMYMVSQLTKPTPKLNQETPASPTYSINGGSNRMRPYQPLQIVIGTHRVYPDLGAKEVVAPAGNDQILFQMLNYGLSNIDLSDHKIGDTPLDSYQDAVLRPATTWWWPGNTDTLAGPALDTVGTWNQLTSPINTVELAVDISGYLFYTGNQGLQPLRVRLDIEYRAVGSSTWLTYNSAPYSQQHDSRELFRFTSYQEVPAGQYEVRVRLGSLDLVGLQYTQTGPTWSLTYTYDPIAINHERVTCNLTWAALRAVREDPADYSDQTRRILQIRANGQLNGTVNTFSSLATGRCEVWNGSIWLPDQITRNPAWWFRWFAKGKTDINGRRLFGGGYTDARLDLDTLVAWGQWCDSKGLQVNMVIDQPKSCHVVLAMIARCGRATLSRGSGKLGVVYDEANLPATAVFNMANIRAGTFRIDYISEKLPDEIVVNWINPNIGYKQDSVRKPLPGISNPVDPVEVTIPGITNETQAGREANLLAAEQVERNRVITWETDLEGLAVARGNVALLAHDLTQWAFSGRLIAGTTTALQLDSEVEFVGGETHYICIRQPDGTFGHYRVNYQTGPSENLTLLDPLPSAPDDDPDHPPLDYIWMFAPEPTPGKAVKITDIVPLSENHVRLVATDETDAYYLHELDAYTYVAPSENITTPTLSNLQINTTLVRAGSGYAIEITASWDATGEYGGAFVRAGFNGAELKDIRQTLDRSIKFSGPERGEVNIEVVGYNNKGQAGEFSRLTGALVFVGLEQPPDDPTGLTLDYLPDQTRRLTPLIAELPVNFHGFEFRARVGSGHSWAAMSVANGGLDLHNELITALPWETAQIPEGSYTIGVTVHDRNGNAALTPFIADYAVGPAPTSPTRTSDLVDDALLGETALWAGVSGPDRPQNNADVTQEQEQHRQTVYFYQVAESQPVAPPAGAGSFDFATGALGEPPGWLAAPPLADTGTLWVTYTTYTLQGVEGLDDGVNTFATPFTSTENHATQNAPDGGFYIVTAEYSGRSLDTSAQVDDPRGIAFKPDGTKMYLVGWDDATMWEYDLSTPWYVQTAVYNGVNMSLSAQMTYCNEIKFSADGTKAFVLDAQFDGLRVYGFSTPWDVSTGSYLTSLAFNAVDPVFSTNCIGLDISADGAKIYVGESISPGIIREIDLSTPWDVSTATYNGNFLTVNANPAIPSYIWAIQLSHDGRFLIITSNGGPIYQWNLSTPWDITSAVYSGNSRSMADDASMPGTARCFVYEPNGFKMYASNGAAGIGAIYQYALDTRA